MFKFLIRHKFSVLGTILFHFFILVFSVYTYLPKVDIDDESIIVINFPEEPEEKIEEELAALKKVNADNYSNKGVNESAPENVKKGEYNEYNREPSTKSKESFDKQLEQELKELEQKVIEEQRDAGYGYSQEQIDDMLDSKKNKNLEEVVEQKPRSEAAYQGNTNITYKLENRFDTRLDVPVYMCQYGGVVVVNIAVNQSGRVVSVKIDEQSSKTSDPCLLDAAIKGAKSTIFNSKSSAPKIQMGSITYRFIDQ